MSQIRPMIGPKTIHMARLATNRRQSQYVYGRDIAHVVVLGAGTPFVGTAANEHQPMM